MKIKYQRVKQLLKVLDVPFPLHNQPRSFLKNYQLTLF